MHDVGSFRLREAASVSSSRECTIVTKRVGVSTATVDADMIGYDKVRSVSRMRKANATASRSVSKLQRLRLWSPP